MLCPDSISRDLGTFGLAGLHAHISRKLGENLRDGAHGKLAEWKAVLESLPSVSVDSVQLDRAVVRAVATSMQVETQNALRELLLSLVPWRKGPFDICDVHIDSEWQSDRKWDRVAPHVSPLRDRLVLDVGCGNGYYALRMRGQGARFVLGIEPTLQYVAQFEAVQRYVRQEAVRVLPLRLADLPSDSRKFDTTFSMGVLYHQRDPQEHLRQLRSTLRDDGELVLETLVLPGELPEAVTPDDRYARMRNVWHLPTISLLQEWLGDSGFDDCRVADTNVTSTEEQRSTEWMPFESLQQALDPQDPRLTVEGLPRPCRATLIARASA